MSVVAVVAEVKAAQAFLKAIGASPTNTDLIYAVVSWMRQESGSLKNVVGNNPFNLRPGKDIDEKLIAGIRKSGNGRFLIFKSLEDGLIATAQRLLRAGNDWRGYGLVVRALRHGSSLDFITAISLSAWDAAHYGYKAPDVTTSHIYRIYATFTGLQLPKPEDPKTKKRPDPVRPRDLNAPIVVRDYIDAHEARRMFLARHKSDGVLPND